MRLLAALFAACVASPAAAADRTGMQLSWYREVAEAAAARGEARDLLVASIVADAAGDIGDDGTAYTEDAAPRYRARAYALGRDAATVQRAAALACLGERHPCDRAAFGRWRALEPGNAFVALVALADAEHRGADREVREALQRIASARAYDDGETSAFRALDAAFARVAAPPDLFDGYVAPLSPEASHAVAVVSTHLLEAATPWPELVRTCRPPWPDAAWREACAAAGRRLAATDAPVMRSLGAEIWHTAGDAREADESRRAWYRAAWQLDQSIALIRDKPWDEPATLIAELDRWRRVDSPARRLEDELRAAGIALDPPPDFRPRRSAGPAP